MKQVVTLQLVLLLVCVLTPIALAGTEEERLQELQKERTRLQKETNPVDRAKIEIRISELVLENVGDAVREGNFTEMEEQLAVYTTTIQDAHQVLIDSGRDAVKKPGGFKELEIALRRHIRKFEDFARALNLQRRVPVEKAKELAVGVRDKLLKKLFP